jgi:hypothetical protein
LFDLEVVFTRRRANRNKKKVYLDILKKEGEKKKGGGEKKVDTFHNSLRKTKCVPWGRKWHNTDGTILQST